MQNADEYWAEGTQAWFEATTRTGLCVVACMCVVSVCVCMHALVRARKPGLGRPHNAQVCVVACMCVLVYVCACMLW